MPYATFCAEAVRFGFPAESKAKSGACKTSKLCLGFHESKPGINLRKESNMSNEIIGTEAQAKELDAALEESSHRNPVQDSKDFRRVLGRGLRHRNLLRAVQPAG